MPEARIVVGHGQMNERELERVMRDFTGQRANVLLCTTIIETGIDNPHANTILINRSEKFGLAQLHQLRGRVGRSHHQAYAYLLVQDENDDQASEATLGSHSVDGRTRLRLLPRHARPLKFAVRVKFWVITNQVKCRKSVLICFIDMLNRAVAALKQGKHLKPPTSHNPLAWAVKSTYAPRFATR